MRKISFEINLRIMNGISIVALTVLIFVVTVNMTNGGFIATLHENPELRSDCKKRCNIEDLAKEKGVALKPYELMFGKKSNKANMLSCNEFKFIVENTKEKNLGDTDQVKYRFLRVALKLIKYNKTYSAIPPYFIREEEEGEVSAIPGHKVTSFGDERVLIEGEYWLAKATYIREQIESNIKLIW